MKRILAATIGLLVILSGKSFAQTQPAENEKVGASTQPQRISKDDNVSITHHSVTIGGRDLAYEALAGTMLLKDDSGKPRANFFFVAYLKDHAQESENRPITFVFNGGPGAAAVWLHLGCVGPQRIVLGPDGIPSPPPHPLMNNDQCWLDATDLVFIDPVGTGFSRPAEGQKASDFFGVQPDLDSVGDFIRLLLTRFQRWDSPKFLAGESYGTARAAGLSEQLLQKYGIDVNGIILISTVLDFQTLDASAENDLPFALYLPSYAAIAVYHHKLQTADEDHFLTEVQDYAAHDYLTALAAGGGLSKDARADVVAHLARYTGLPPELIDRANLRVDPDMFRKQLLADQRLILGRFDARITGIDSNPAGQYPQYDPSLSRYLPVYSSAFNNYVRRQLHFDSDLDYKVLSPDVRPWDFHSDEFGGYLNFTRDLKAALEENPNMKVLVCSGYEDLATPFLATKYTLNHLDLMDRLQGAITQTFYHSGHMIYHDPESLKQLKANVSAFISSAAGSGAAKPGN
jgi:carboxypeptidase C (cathepsin A)